MKHQVLLSLLFITVQLVAADEAPAFVSPDAKVSQVFEQFATCLEQGMKAGEYEASIGWWKQMKAMHEEHASYAQLPLAQREPGRWAVSDDLLAAQAQRLETWKQQIVAGRTQHVRNAPGSWKSQIFWWTLGTTVTLGVVCLVARKCGWLDVSGEALAKPEDKEEKKGTSEA